MQRNNNGTANPLPKDILISLLKQFWNKTYIQDATFSFLRNISDDFIEDMENKTSSEKDKILVEIIQVLKGEQIHKALDPLKNALKKADNWKPNNGVVFAEEILLLVKDLDQSGIDILLNAYIDDSDFKTKIAEIDKNSHDPNLIILERSLSNRNLLNSYKVLKNRRLKEEIMKNGYFALEKITLRLKNNQTGIVHEKLHPLYKLLQEKYSVKKKSGFKILL